MLTEAQRENFRHAIRGGYRNYYAATPRTSDALSWEAAVAKGFAVRGKVINRPPCELQVYHVTHAGLSALVSHWHGKPAVLSAT